MKKFAKQSLVAVLALASASSYAMSADSLADAFKNGKIKGSIKSYYFMEDYKSATKNDNNVWANGGMLTYKTNSFKGLKLGATFQASNVTNIDDPQKKQRDKMNVSGAVLSEAYLDYKFKNTKFKGGRQFIKLPLIAGSGSRLIKESFEAYMLTNTDIPNTLISIGKVTKYQTRTNDVTSIKNGATFDNNSETFGDTSDFHDIGINGKGAYSLYIKNKSINNLTTQLHYVDFKDEVKSLYVDGIYKFKAPMKPYIGVQYFRSDYADAAEENSYIMGYKLGATIAGIKAHIAYNKTDDANTVIRGIGASAINIFAKNKAATGTFTAGTKAWQVALSKKFGKFYAGTKYTMVNAISDKGDLKEASLDFKYKFTKNLSAQIELVNYDYGKGSEAKEKNEMRSRLIYKF